MVLIAQTTSEGSGKPAHLRSLARAFAVCTHEVWMDELVFYVPSTVFQSFRDDGRVNVRLCAMKRRLGSGRISPPVGFEPATP